MSQPADPGSRVQGAASAQSGSPVRALLVGDLGSRLLAIALTVAMALVLQDWNLWIGFVISFGFAHYLLSFWYARKRIGALARDRDLAVPLLGLGTLLLLVVFLRFPLEIYFGIHHACNEAYLRRRGPADEDRTGRLAAARGLLHLAAYLCILRDDTRVSVIPEPALWGLLVLSLGVLLHQAVDDARKAGDGFAAALRDLSVEWLMLAVVLASFLVEITFLQLVLYHFVLWTIVPVRILRQQGGGAMVEYSVLTVGALALFLALALLQAAGERADLGFWYAQFLLWSYVHITTSFALSAAHPAWIVKLFRPGPSPSR